MEVYEEHEFNFVDNRRRNFEKVRNLKLIEAQRLEAAENRRKHEVERRRNQVKARNIKSDQDLQKNISRKIAKKYLANVGPVALQLLEDQGTLADSLGILIYEQAAPWLYEQMMKFMKEDDIIDNNTEELVEEALIYPARAHHETVDQDNEKKRQKERDHEKRLMEKEERKRKRQEAREEAKKLEELQKFKEAVQNEFVEGGNLMDRILIHPITDVDGSQLNKHIAGVTGGPLIQVIVTLAVVYREHKEELEKLWNFEELTRFFVTYLSQNWKGDFFYIKYGQHAVEFVQHFEETLKNAKKGKPDYTPLREFLNDKQNGLINEQVKELLENSEELGLDREFILLVHQAIAEIIVGKTDIKDMKELRFQKAHEKIDMILPTQEGEGDTQIGAIVRIKIPMEEVKDEEDQKSIDKSMDKKVSLIS
jgi:hypothetical protein